MAQFALSCGVKVGQSFVSLSRATFSMFRQSGTLDSRQLGPTSNSGTRSATVTISCELSIAAYTENGIATSEQIIRARGNKHTMRARSWRDSTAAFNAAVAALPNGGQVRVPRGNYKLSPLSTITTGGIQFQCESELSTLLQRNAPTGNLISLSGGAPYASVRDCSFYSLVAD